MELAKREAFELVKKDRFLSRPENRHIRENLRKKFDPGVLALATVG